MMNSDSIQKVREFIDSDKLSAQDWDDRGLHPSDDEVIEQMKTIIDGAGFKLIHGLEQGYSVDRLHTVLRITLNATDQSLFDTEELEFIGDLFHQLAAIVQIELGNDLDEWMYGMKGLSEMPLPVGSFIPEEENIISQRCVSCGKPLRTTIVEDDGQEPGIEMWIIGRCTNCRDFNLVFIDAKVKEVHIRNYESVGSLSGDKYTAEEANRFIEELRKKNK